MDKVKGYLDLTNKVVVSLFLLILISVFTYGLFENDAGSNTESNVTPTPQSEAPQQVDPYKEKDYEMMMADVINTPRVYEKAKKEVERLLQNPAFSNEAGEIRSYLDRLFDYPWEKKDATNIDLALAEKTLDRDHAGLKKVKDHILEYLAVQKRVPSSKAPILCFVGPPGVGKTSISKAIAEATGRKFARISLGGAHDESKIRGFMRTYVGARPGDIASALTQAGSNNPVILLDEIDKIGQNTFHGDPSAALLEVLDPEQNQNFKDNYFELGLDLSQVMFIATANSMDIHPALRDRLELVHLNGYTPQEKLNIARTKLLPKLLTKNGLSDSEFKITDAAIKELIQKYTLEAGIRQLNRSLDTLCRKVVKSSYEHGPQTVTVTPQDLKTYLGGNIIPSAHVMTANTVGVSQGLGVTEMGGDVILIETAFSSGQGHLTMTGGLGNFCQESIRASLTLANSLGSKYKFDPKILKERDIHIHARGQLASQIDGSSAGTAIVTSILSTVLNRPVKKDVCMTGEINLRGEVLQVGGIPGKLTAAHAAGIKRALIPFDNMNDVEDLSDDVKKDMEIIPVRHIREVLDQALMA